MYKHLLETKKMTTAFRLGNKTETYGPEKYNLVVSWPDSPKIQIGEIEITDSYLKKIKDLEPLDFEGQSSECKTIDMVCLCLSSIYRKVVSQSDYITIIKWKANFSQKSDSHKSERLTKFDRKDL